MGLFGNLFNKNKINYKITKEQENKLVIMLCLKKRVKLGMKICVPENFCAVSLSKEKLLDVIPSGEYEINGYTLTKTCEKNRLDKPTKKGYKKFFSADFYFVNLKECVIKNQLHIKRYNLDVEFKLNFKVKNAKIFLQFLFYESIVFNDNFASDELNFFVSQLIYDNILLNKAYNYESINLCLSKNLNDIGIEIINFDCKDLMSNNTNYYEKALNNNLQNDEKNNQIYENQVSDNYDKQTDVGCYEEINKTKRYVGENNTISSSVIDLSNVSSSSIEYFVCDNCGAMLPKNCEECFSCKKSFIEKRTCDNCGAIVEENEYVCHSCGAVII